MIAFGKLSVGTVFIYEGFTWTKTAPYSARKPGGSAYPFPYAMKVQLA